MGSHGLGSGPSVPKMANSYINLNTYLETVEQIIKCQLIMENLGKLSWLKAENMVLAQGHLL